jgi:outer membrane protein assembly factor BamD (BamD/ComL family)
MHRWSVRLFILTAFLLLYPFRSPAPFVYRPGEGWSYEPVGGEGKWQMNRAEDQLAVAQAAFDKKAYGLSLKAARRVARVWPNSDFVPQAIYLGGRCLEALGDDEKAFNEYQKLLEKYPKLPNYDEVLKRQYEIAGKYLGGKWFKLWGYIPFFPSMERTADMYAKVVRNGPYSPIAPEAQLKIGTAYESEKTFWFSAPDYPSAVKAYELAADRYHDRPAIASEALYRAANAYNKEAKTAEYDQTTAGQAIATYTEFAALYPNDARVSESQKNIASLKTEQARGNFQIAKFYEKYKKWKGAMVYYNEVVVEDPNSPYAAQARERINVLKQRVQPTENAEPTEKPGQKGTEPKKTAEPKGKDEPRFSPLDTSPNQ